MAEVGWRCEAEVVSAKAWVVEVEFGHGYSSKWVIHSYLSLRFSQFLLYGIYERFAAIDRLVGEACALVEATDLARRMKWSRVEFECNSLVLGKEILEDGSPSWPIASLVVKIRRGLEEFADWRIA